MSLINSFWFFFKESNSNQIQEKIDYFLKQKKFWIIVVIFFSLRLLTSLTPCIYPLIPITLNILTKRAHLRTRRQNLLLANIYVLGMALTYAFLGLLAARSGELFGSHIQSPFILSIVCIVFLIMALSSFDLFEIGLPVQFQIWLQSASNHIGAGLISVFFTGVISGLIAGPCLGPVLISILTYIAQTQDLWLGFWSLFSFALGMGQLLLLIGLSSQIVRWLPKSGTWMNMVKHILGLLMLGMFYYYLKLLVSLRIWEFLLGLGLIGLAAILKSLFLEEGQNNNKKYELFDGFRLVLIFLGGLFIFWSLLNLSHKTSQIFYSADRKGLNFESSFERISLWQKFSEDLLETAKKNQQSVIIDFTAEWCESCKVLESEVFSHPQFIDATKNIMLLKFDATHDSPELKKIKQKYFVQGLPTIVFINREGHFTRDDILMGVTDLNEILKMIQKINH